MRDIRFFWFVKRHSFTKLVNWTCKDPTLLRIMIQVAQSSVFVVLCKVRLIRQSSQTEALWLSILFFLLSRIIHNNDHFSRLEFECLFSELLQYFIFYVNFQERHKKRTHMCIDMIKTILLFSTVRSISNVCTHLYTHTHMLLVTGQIDVNSKTCTCTRY